MSDNYQGLLGIFVQAIEEISQFETTKSWFADGHELCAYCGQPVKKQRWPQDDSPTIEHIYPRSRGGTDNPFNRITACQACNLRKARKHPLDWFQFIAKKDNGYETIDGNVAMDLIARLVWEQHVQILRLNKALESDEADEGLRRKLLSLAHVIIEMLENDV